MNAAISIKHGNRYPFDASDSWWRSARKPPAPEDWAHAAARGIIADLKDRQGIKHELSRDKIDETTRAEIVSSIAAIIRKASK